MGEHDRVEVSHLSTVESTEADVPTEDLNSDPWGGDTLAAPQSQSEGRPRCPLTNLWGREGSFLLLIHAQ